MKNLFYLFFLIILFGCKDNEPIRTKKSIDLYNFTFYFQKTANNQTQNDNTTWIEVDTTRKTIIEKDYNSIVNTKLNDWIKSSMKENPSFNINQFTQCKTWFLQPYIMDIEDYTDVQKFIRLYKSYLIWNTDSTKAIDLYSNNLILDYDENGNIIRDTDVDPHFALMDFKNNKRIVLWQMGAISTFEGGFWLNDNNVIITARWANFDEENKDNLSVEFSYYLVNLKTYQTYEFCSK